MQNIIANEVSSFLQVVTRSSIESYINAAMTLLQHYLVSQLPSMQIVVVNLCVSMSSIISLSVTGFHMAFLQVYSQNEHTNINLYSIAQAGFILNFVIVFGIIEFYMCISAIISVFLDTHEASMANTYMWIVLLGLLAHTFNCVLKYVLVFRKRAMIKSTIVVSGMILRGVLSLVLSRSHGYIGLAVAYSTGSIAECCAYVICNIMFCCKLSFHELANPSMVYIIEYTKVGVLSMVTTVTSCNYLHVSMLLVQYMLTNTEILLHTFMFSIATIEYYTQTSPIFNTSWSRTMFSDNHNIVMLIIAFYTLFSSVLVILSNMIFGFAISSVYTSDPVLQERLVRHLPFVALYCNMEKTLASLTGVLHGHGEQIGVATVNFIGYMIIGPMLQVVLQKTYGLVGAWIAMSATSILMITASAFLLRLKILSRM